MCQSHPPSLSLPAFYPGNRVCFLHLCFHSCFVNQFICNISFFNQPTTVLVSKEKIINLCGLSHFLVICYGSNRGLINIIKSIYMDFPDGPVVKTSSFNARIAGLVGELKIPCALRLNIYIYISEATL